MSELKLKPCPFCGGKAVKMAFSWGNICDEYTVKCTECGVGTKVLKSDEAVKSWNTRKPMDNIVERLKKEREQCFDSSSEIEETGNIVIADRYFYKGMGFINAIRIIAEGGVED